MSFRVSGWGRLVSVTSASVNNAEDRSQSQYWRKLAKDDLERARQLAAQGLHGAEQGLFRQASIASLKGAHIAKASGEDLPPEWETALAYDEQVRDERRDGDPLQAEYYREQSLHHALLAVMHD